MRETGKIRIVFLNKCIMMVFQQEIPRRSIDGATERAVFRKIGF